MMKDVLKSTLKLQPIVLLYSCVSVCSKLASKEIPLEYNDIWDFLFLCLTNFRLITIVAVMFIILFIYAIIWQKVIKKIDVSVAYANKSSYIFWTQLAAIFLFKEHITLSNIIGIVVIFWGIMVVNNDRICE